MFWPSAEYTGALLCVQWQSCVPAAWLLQSWDLRSTAVTPGCCLTDGANTVQGLALLTANPVLANGIAGLATSATAQATVQVRHLMGSDCGIPCLTGQDPRGRAGACAASHVAANHIRHSWEQLGLHDVTGDAARVQRFLLWERRNNTVMPFKETVQQVWARISALRDSLDGPQVRLLPSLALWLSMF